MINDVVIRKGSVTLLGSDGMTGLGEWRDCELRLNLRGEKPGTLRASSAIFLNRLEVREISGDITVEGSTLRISNLAAKWAAGRISGKAEANLGHPAGPFAAGIDTTIDLAKIAPEIVPAGTSAESNRTTAQLRVQGYARTLETVRGALVFDGLSIPRDAIQATGKNLGFNSIQRIEDFDFEIARILFSLRQGAVVLDEFNFNADRVVVRAAGRTTSGGGLNLTIRGYVPATAVSSLAKLTKGWPEYRLIPFEPLENTTYIYRDVPVGGNIQSPLVDLWNDGRFLPLDEIADEIASFREAAKSPGAAGESTVGIR